MLRCYCSLVALRAAFFRGVRRTASVGCLDFAAQPRWLCLLVSQAASPRKISTPSRFVLLLGALFGRLAHGYEACARGPRERLAQHLCALLGSHRCKGCNPARSETCEGRRRVVVAAEHHGSGPVAPAARRGRLHGTGTSTSPTHATISVRRQKRGRRRRRARQCAFPGRN